MPIINLKCPSCGANMTAEEGRNTYFCPYCGGRIENAAERIEINIKHDRTGEPNLVIHYSSTKHDVAMTVRIVSTNQKYTYLSGQTATYHLAPGMQKIIIKIGKKNYARDVFITPDKPVTVNASFNGRRQISIDQPPYTAEELKEYGYAVEPGSIPEDKPMSKTAIVAFILSLTGVASLVGFVLAFIDIVKGDKTKRHGLAVAAVIIGALMSTYMLYYLVNKVVGI